MGLKDLKVWNKLSLLVQFLVRQKLRVRGHAEKLPGPNWALRSERKRCGERDESSIRRSNFYNPQQCDRCHPHVDGCRWGWSGNYAWKGFSDAMECRSHGSNRLKSCLHRFAEGPASVMTCSDVMTLQSMPTAYSYKNLLKKRHKTTPPKNLWHPLSMSDHGATRRHGSTKVVLFQKAFRKIDVDGNQKLNLNEAMEAPSFKGFQSGLKQFWEFLRVVRRKLSLHLHLQVWILFQIIFEDFSFLIFFDHNLISYIIFCVQKRKWMNFIAWTDMFK